MYYKLCYLDFVNFIYSRFGFGFFTILLDCMFYLEVGTGALHAYCTMHYGCAAVYRCIESSKLGSGRDRTMLCFFFVFFVVTLIYTMYHIFSILMHCGLSKNKK